jgi:DNA invertase Pin-like site-specific DNA recombinase
MATITQEQTKAVMRAARARGSPIGNKAMPFDEAKASALRDDGWGEIRIAKALGVGVGCISGCVRREYLPPHQR